MVWCIAGNIADRIAVLRAGRIEEQGACDEVSSRPTQNCTRTMLAAVPQLVLSKYPQQPQVQQPEALWRPNARPLTRAKG